MPSYVVRESLDVRACVQQELETAAATKSAEDWPIIERLRKIVPFDDFAFSGLDVEGCGVGTGLFFATSLPKAATRTYTSEKFLEIDPLVASISADRPIASWDRLDQPPRETPRTRALFQLLSQNDIAPRTTLTFWNGVRLYGAATFTRRKAFSDDELATLEMFAGVVHSSLAKPLVDAVNQRLGLIGGEILCLELASKGLTSEEIAGETPYTVDTVNSYFKSAARKLQANSRAHAVAEALRRKIIA